MTLDLETVRSAWTAHKAAIRVAQETRRAREPGTPRTAVSGVVSPEEPSAWMVKDETGKRLELRLNLDTFAALRVLTAGRSPRIIGNIDLRADDDADRLAAFTPVEQPQAQMTPDDLAGALATLGKAWGLDRPLHNSEMARALRLGGRDPGRSVQDWLTGATKITGPVQVAIIMMLAGALPPDPLDIIVRKRL